MKKAKKLILHSHPNAEMVDESDVLTWLGADATDSEFLRGVLAEMLTGEYTVKQARQDYSVCRNTKMGMVATTKLQGRLSKLYEIK